jgi:hypothetical protein
MIRDQPLSCCPVVKIKKLKYKKTYVFSWRNVFIKKIAGKFIIAKPDR